MDTKSLSEKLASTDELHKWGDIAKLHPEADRKLAFESAVPLWIRRMVLEWKLMLHPSVIEDLGSQNWEPTELQSKMIWASIVCKLEKPDQQAEKARIRSLLQRRYGNDWWEDVYARAGKVWPAWDRARKRVFSHGPGVNIMAQNSQLVRKSLYEEFQAALRMVPDA